MRSTSAGNGGRIGGCSRRHQWRQVRLEARHCRPRLVRQKPLQPWACLCWNVNCTCNPPCNKASGRRHSLIRPPCPPLPPPC